MKKITIAILSIMIIFNYACIVTYASNESANIDDNSVKNEIDSAGKIDKEEKKIEDNEDIEQEKQITQESNELDNKEEKSETYEENKKDIEPKEKIQDEGSTSVKKYSTQSNVSATRTVSGQRTIEDGEYEIRSSANQSKIFDISGGSTDNGAVLQLWEDCDVTQQRFYFKYLGDGTYKVEIRKSGKVLDVPGATTVQGYGVQQYTSNGSDAQKWIIKYNGDGTYSIVSKCNGYYMTATNSIFNGTKIKLFEENSNSNQKFILDKVIKVSGKRTIEDGEYEIISSANHNKIWDISGGSTDNGAVLQLWEDSDVTQQRFNFKYLGDGTYKIEVRKSGKVLDVPGATIKQGYGVQQYTSNGSDAQRWIIKENEDGTYSFVSKCNGYYITASNSVFNGAKIKLLNESSDDCQKFILDKVIKVSGKRTIEDGEYEIKSAIRENKVFDVSGGSSENCATVQLWESSLVTQQRFYVKYLNDGTYKIEVRKSGKVLDVPGATIKQGYGIQQYTSNGSDAQKWIIKDNEDGTYSIISNCNGYYITTKDDDVKDGTLLKLYKEKNTANQKFVFDLVIKDVGTKTIDDGVYEIHSKAKSNKVLDISGGSVENGAKLQIWEDCDVPQQRYYIKYNNDGTYTIKVRKSGKSLDVPGARRETGLNVQQYDSNDSDAQKWIIKKNSDGTYSFISRCNGYYLTIMDEDIQNGTEIQLFENQGIKNQKFKFQRINEVTLDGIDVSSYNYNIDWSKVKSSGIDFAFIRIGYRGYESGRVVFDNKYEYNIRNAINNNVDVGIYFYSQATTVEEAIDEANFCINNVRGYGITYPIVIDSEYATSSREGRADKLSKSQRTDVCVAFCETIKKAGYTPMIYASKSWFYDQLDMSRLKDYKIWVAHYTDNPDNKTDFRYEYDIWQYTSKGKVQGIGSEYVDRNIQFVK